MAVRILLVTDSYPPFIGGADRQTQLIAQAMVQRGHQVWVATPWQPGLAKYEDDQGVQVHRLKSLASLMAWASKDPKRRHHPPFPDLGTAWGLRRLIQQVHPDVVHSYGWITYSSAAALLGKDIPLLVSARDYGNFCAVRNLLNRGKACDGPAPVKCLLCATKLYGAPKALVAVAGIYGSRPLLLRKMRALHSNSSFTQRMIRRGLLRKYRDTESNEADSMPQVIIHSFRALSDNELQRSKTDIQQHLSQLPAEPFILFVGALRPIKGIDVLIEAYQRLASPPPLVLIGPVEHDTPRVVPNGVTVIPGLPHQAVMAAWERSLFGVLPSLWPEPFGNVVHEGMSKGKAVIGTVPGGHADLIGDGESGLLVSSGDVDALAAAMQRLIADAGLRTRLGQAAFERSAAFTAATIIPQFEQLYQRLARRTTGYIDEVDALTPDSR
jgi:glycosyltransferase involved in cell wall biosynthesis